MFFLAICLIPIPTIYQKDRAVFAWCISNWLLNLHGYCTDVMCLSRVDVNLDGLKRPRLVILTNIQSILNVQQSWRCLHMCFRWNVFQSCELGNTFALNLIELCSNLLVGDFSFFITKPRKIRHGRRRPYLELFEKMS